MKQRRALFLLLLLATGGASAQQKAFQVYFATGSTILDETARTTLDRLVYRDLIHDGATWEITGYADKPGSDALNDSLSLQRARRVADYLVSENFLKAGSIVAISGAGSATAETDGDDRSLRRVDIRRHDNGVPAPKDSARAKPIASLQVGETVLLSGVNFYGGSAEFVPTAAERLQELLRFMQENPAVRIRLEGHICCPVPRGNFVSSSRNDYNFERENEWLSTKRAKAVVDYLVSKGVSPGRMEYKGFGNSRMKVFPELGPAHQQANRRVEVRVLSR